MSAYRWPCEDCGANAELGRCRQCSATVCAACFSAYHGGNIRLGCAARAGKELVRKLEQRGRA